MNVVLIRHTRLSGHEGLCYGRHDLEVASTFAAEAALVRRHLPWVPDRIVSSPAGRCLKLAAYLNRSDTVEREERLAEMHFGSWEGTPWDRLSGPIVEAWMKDPWTARPPGGESALDLVQRVREFRAELLSGGKSEYVALVTHAGVIRAWWSIARGCSLEECFRVPVEYGGVYQAK